MNQPLQLSKYEIQEFIKVHAKVSGEVLDFEEAKKMATKLMRIMVLVVTKKPKSDNNKVTTT
jgi:hypothetical protein